MKLEECLPQARKGFKIIHRGGQFFTETLLEKKWIAMDKLNKYIGVNMLLEDALPEVRKGARLLRSSVPHIGGFFWNGEMLDGLLDNNWSVDKSICPKCGK